MNGAFIARNAGTGSSFFSASARVGRVFRVRGRVEVEALVEAFNVTNRRNVIARNANFGSGAYPANPSPAFGEITALGEPRTLQFEPRTRF